MSQSAEDASREDNMSDREDYDSDAPEEFTAEQGVLQEEEIAKIQKENKARVLREGKQRRRKWAQRITPRPSKKEESISYVPEFETFQESQSDMGMLPDNIVQMLAAREKQVFSSDSEDEKPEVKPTSRNEKSGKPGLEPVILSEIGPPPCLQSSLDFLNRRKMSVSRSTAVLNNSNQALRLISTCGVLRGNK